MINPEILHIAKHAEAVAGDIRDAILITATRQRQVDGQFEKLEVANIMAQQLVKLLQEAARE